MRCSILTPSQAARNQNKDNKYKYHLQIKIYIYIHLSNLQKTIETTMTITYPQLCTLLNETLQLNTTTIDKNTALLNSLPEFDSITLLTLLTTLEKKYHIQIEDDEITSGIFTTVGTLWHYLQEKNQQIQT